MFESANRHSIFVLIFRRRCYLGPITSDYFKVGHCYYEVDPADPCPPVMLCRKSLLFGKQLVPYDGLFKFPISCSSEEVCRGFWFDCTEQVKRSEAMRNCDTCPLVPLRKEHIGTVIAFPVGEKMSDPHFLYAYDNSMAFLMKLDGTCFSKSATRYRRSIRISLSGRFPVTRCVPLSLTVSSSGYEVQTSTTPLPLWCTERRHLLRHRRQ